MAMEIGGLLGYNTVEIEKKMAMNGITAVHLHGKCGAKGFLWDLAANSMVGFPASHI